MKEFKGISASLGTGIGTPFVLPDEVRTVIPRRTIRRDEVDAGWARFQNALEKARKDILKLSDSVNEEQKAIFDTHLMMLSDPDFISLVKNRYETSLLNIEYVVSAQIKEFTENLRQGGDPYLMLRAADIEDVYGRVVEYLAGNTIDRTECVPSGTILIARGIKPSEAVVLRQRSLAGIVLEEGGTNSHVAILARSYGVPAVMGISGITKAIRDAEAAHGALTVIIDGKSGTVIVDPSPDVLTEYSDKSREEKAGRERLAVYKERAAVTADGTSVELLANIGIPEDVAVARAEGALGIGLFRSEFLFMKAGEQVGEEAQFAAYKSVLSEMNGGTVVIRTLDAGGDKVIAGQEETGEKNPLLGWRAIRLCLSRADLFKTQLRALLRASVFGRLKIMFPLITGYDELEEALAIAEAVKTELRAEGVPFDEDVPFGIMVETPAAVLIAPELARRCAFFSIGTNDLTQYTLAVDRENQNVSNLFTEFHPAVLRLIRMTVCAARDAGIPVSVCGEFAGRADGALLLAGLGVRSFSMSANSLNAVKAALSERALAELEDIASKALSCHTGGEVEELVRGAVNARSVMR